METTQAFMTHGWNVNFKLRDTQELSISPSKLKTRLRKHLEMALVVISAQKRIKLNQQGLYPRTILILSSTVYLLMLRVVAAQGY